MIEIVASVLLVAFATSLGWGLRGEWGHWWGATVPGAFCGMSLWLAFGQTHNAWQMLVFGATLAVSISLGGVLSYGKIVGYVKSQHDRSPLFGLFGLFLVGGLWGFFGGTALGLLMTDLVYTLSDLMLWAILASLGAFLTYKLLVLGLDLHLSPPRSDVWAAVLGGCLATVAFFALGPKDTVVLRTAFMGWLGFGGGFSLGAAIHRWCTKAGWQVDSWKFMEHSVGFWGGLSLGISAALMGHNLDCLPIVDSTCLVSALVVLWFVPYMNISDNFHYWFQKYGFVSRRIYALFQILALISLIIFIHLVWNLVKAWDGMKGYLWPFVAMIILMTIVGIAKFRFCRTRQRLLIDATFIGEVAACLLLLLLI